MYLIKKNLTKRKDNELAKTVQKHVDNYVDNLGKSDEASTLQGTRGSTLQGTTGVVPYRVPTITTLKTKLSKTSEDDFKNYPQSTGETVELPPIATARSDLIGKLSM